MNIQQIQYINVHHSDLEILEAQESSANLKLSEPRNFDGSAMSAELRCPHDAGTLPSGPRTVALNKDNNVRRFSAGGEV